MALNNGDEIVSLQTDNSGGIPNMLGTLRRISILPAPPNW